MDQRLVGLMPWLALAIVQAVFPGVFGLLAVAVRRLPGWPLWFAGLWALAEWAKSTVPFGGFPWGVVGFGQTDGPLLPLAQIGGAPLVSFAVALLGFSLAALAFEIVDWWRRGAHAEPRRRGTARRGAARRLHLPGADLHGRDLAAGPAFRCGRRG